MKTITIKQLHKCLGEAVKSGIGDKKILISDDEEGNGYHECFFGISPTNGNVSEDQLPFGVTLEEALENYVIIG